MAFKEVTTLEAAYLKAGLFGTQGSGKTRTAMELAIGLHRHIKSQKGIAFYDTETGSDFVLPIARAAGIKVFVDKSTSFVDLLSDIREAPKFADVLIVDSITHPWRELVKSYKARKGKSFLRIQDWGPLKEEWAKFSHLYTNSKLHIILCGRSSNIFEDVEEAEDVNTSTWKAVKVGTKMATETETGYEPSLLVEMHKLFLKEGGKYVRRASVIKDRFGIIDSKDFDFSAENPPGYVFQCFLPHIERLNLGGEHIGVDATRTSEELWGKGGESFEQRRKQQQVWWEEIEGLKARHIPGSTAKERMLWTNILQAAFGTPSETAIKDKLPNVLKQGRNVVEHLLMFALENEAPSNAKDWPAWLQKERERFLEEEQARLEQEKEAHNNQIEIVQPAESGQGDLL